jgi:phage shock protein PspC (stress-responsive transcriptional regulator)
MKVDKKNAMIGGVCAGLSDSTGIPTAVFRLAFLFAFLLAGMGPIIYIILWIMMQTKE